MHPQILTVCQAIKAKIALVVYQLVMPALAFIISSPNSPIPTQSILSLLFWPPFSLFNGVHLPKTFQSLSFYPKALFAFMPRSQRHNFGILPVDAIASPCS